MQPKDVAILLPICCSALLVMRVAGGEVVRMTDENPLALPARDACRLRVLTSNLLELTRVTASGTNWNWVDTNGGTHLPEPSEFIVQVNERRVPIEAVGFKRRVLYAPLAQRDLRIGNWLYLRLGGAITNGQIVVVKNAGANLWPTNCHFIATMEPRRYSPSLHVNQVGYLPGFSKHAMVGYFIGSLGEMELPKGAEFDLVDARTGTQVFAGKLRERRDAGFTDASYQRVLEADFTDFNTTGEYQLVVPGLGASLPFMVDVGVAAAFARTYALGLYHQRCGISNTLPFTRFVHDGCHTAPAEVPTAQFANMEQFLAEITADFTNDPRHTAPQLKDFASSLYPIVKRGKLDVSGGHHDAGDYSKYTINSAGLIHALVFAADALPGVGALDNFGLPESGDGKSDLLQEAKWEADFLAKMQDDDGGFYFLVYPKERKYENNVLPDHGDPQIVWPKNTAASAAAVAALAQAASSPLFKQQFPEAAALYLDKAKKGWAFLDRAIAKYGRYGAYQKITHYGDDFMHDDELAWAACELFLATGDESFHKKLITSFAPDDVRTRRWGWWRLYESYGRAIRSYAFAARTGRLKTESLNPLFRRRCEAELVACADDQLRWSQQSAYGTSFPTDTKRFRGGGWYFSLDQAFDLAVACALDHPIMNDPRPKYLSAILENLNYEAGCNPVNISYVAGLGWNRPREMVHQFAQNDRHVLPPSGIPWGNIQSGFGWLDAYKAELRELSFPSDSEAANPYPIYDRWGDSFNVQTEFVIVNQARALAALAFLMARTPLKDQPWRALFASIEFQAPPADASGLERIATPKVAGLDLRQARIVWEAQDQEPRFGTTFAFTLPTRGSLWLEAEVQMPDGRRVFAVTNTMATAQARR